MKVRWVVIVLVLALAIAACSGRREAQQPLDSAASQSEPSQSPTAQPSSAPGAAPQAGAQPAPPPAPSGETTSDFGVAPYPGARQDQEAGEFFDKLSQLGSAFAVFVSGDSVEKVAEYYRSQLSSSSYSPKFDITEVDLEVTLSGYLGGFFTVTTDPNVLAGRKKLQTLIESSKGQKGKSVRESLGWNGRTLAILIQRPRLTPQADLVDETVIFVEYRTAEPAVTHEFTKGQFQFSHGGRPYSVGLASGTVTTAGNRMNIHLAFMAQEIKPGASLPELILNAELALRNIPGAGSYGNNSIVSLAVAKQEISGATSSTAWRFDQGKSDCTVIFKKLDAAGAEGTLTCTGMVDPSTGKSLSLDATLTAAP